MALGIRRVANEHFAPAQAVLANILAAEHAAASPLSRDRAIEKAPHRAGRYRGRQFQELEIPAAGPRPRSLPPDAIVLLAADDNRPLAALRLAGQLHREEALVAFERRHEWHRVPH